MSASPSGMSNGRTPTPNGAPPQFVRKPKAADPLVQRKKPVRRPNVLPSGGKPNGRAATPGQNASNPAAQARRPGVPAPAATSTLPKANGGWTNPPTGPYQDYPLLTTKKALREGLRYHMARFAARKDVDPTNQDEFTRPVSLHRRDPRQPPPGKAVKDEDTVMETPMDSKERERLEILKAEKEARRAADLAQIAPTGSNASTTKKSQAFRNEKTTQVHRLDKTEEQKKESDLRYEEALPWHLEDADNKNTWVGNYEAALSDTNVIFVIDGTDFKMIPIEKWYRFTPKNQFKALTIEEAEALLSKKTRESRWAMKTHEMQEADRAKQETRKQLNNLYTVKSESSTFRKVPKTEYQDMDDLDFEADDLFQDDDEMPTVEPDRDEDAKDAQDRIKREQLGANVFGQANEAEVEKELNEEEKEAERRRKLGKGVRKALQKREKNYIYETDSEHPYSSSSEDITSDEEKQAERDRRKDEEAKLKAKAESKGVSGTSSKGSSTPSGRPKHSEPLKSKTLKRAGSPNLSESSGNESSRKKHKKKHQLSASQPTGSTSQPGSRPMSPSPSQPLPSTSPRKSSIIKLNLNPSKLSEIQSAPPNPNQTNNAMSDGEATGGEMSDGAGGKRKIKLRLGGSRTGSPAPGKAGGSRAGSPATQAPAPAAPGGSPRSGPVSAQEIAAAIPASGIAINNLMRHFIGRVGDQRGMTDKKEFIRLVKENSVYGPDKLLRPKP